MAAAPKAGIFLERRSYRRRRLIDALRLLPVVSAWLFLLPIFWPVAGDATGAALSMSSALLYIFAVWALIVMCTGTLLIALERIDRTRRNGQAARTDGA